MEKEGKHKVEATEDEDAEETGFEGGSQDKPHLSAEHAACHSHDNHHAGHSCGSPCSTCRKVDIDTSETKGSSLKIVMSILAIVLILFAVFIVAIRYTSNDDDTLADDGTFTFEDMTEYHGYKFYKGNDGSWYTHIQVKDRDSSHMVELKYPPWEVEDIAVEDSVKETLAKAKRVYLTTDPDMTGKTVVGMMNLGRVLGTKYDIYNKETKGALTREPDASDPTVPVKTCDDVNATDAVVLFQTGDTTEVYELSGCVIVQGVTEEDIRKAADRTTYSLLNIIA